GKYEQSLTLYQRALKLRQQHLSPQHPDLAETLHDLARLYHLQGDYTQARSLYQQALDIYQPVFGSDHLRTKQAEEVIAQLTQEMAQPKKPGSDGHLAPEPEGSLLCACGCGRPIDRSKSHGEPRRFFSAACRQRVYRYALRNKRHTQYEVSHNRRK
ncbi:MAG TPA: tetratricopeptide repeat protein, partial [Ktedonobacteraceae bacterium]|nr:tetratricopeptide repeat protein [Ktedonobacteraceae bacterium]